MINPNKRENICNLYRKKLPYAKKCFCLLFFSKINIIFVGRSSLSRSRKEKQNMLTLKVITTGLNGQAVTHLLSGDAITHREYFSKDHCIVSKIREDNPMVRCIGDILESSSEQPFVVSEVKIYEDNHSYKNELFILPKAECYIMENGKTVDAFFCGFEVEGTEIKDLK